MLLKEGECKMLLLLLLLVVVIVSAVTGDYPPGRYFHNSCMMGDLMVVFGGYTGAHKKTQDPSKTATVHTVSARSSC